MKGLVKVAPVVIIICCALSLLLAFKLGKDRKDLRLSKQQLEADLGKTKGTLSRTQNDLSDTRNQLATTQDQLSKTTAELKAATVSLQAKQQEAETLAAAKQELESQLADTKTKLAEAEASVKPLRDKLAVLQDQGIEELSDKVATFTVENEVLAGKVKSLEAEREELLETIKAQGQTPPGTRGQVAVAKHDWNFVVLDVGADDKVRARSDFLLYRGSKLIARARVTTVNQSNCVAELLPEFTVSMPRAGDSAMSAPATKEM